MYETFVKQFIDIMDERAPVVLVRSRLETPLGSVSADQSTLIHTRLDLMDDDSPNADVVITPKEGFLQVDYIAHIPADDRMTDEQLTAKIQEVAPVDSISVIQSIDGRHDSMYVITSHKDINLTNHDQNTNSATHDISEEIAAILRCGGYESVMENNGVTDESVVTWHTEA